MTTSNQGHPLDGPKSETQLTLNLRSPDSSGHLGAGNPADSSYCGAPRDDNMPATDEIGPRPVVPPAYQYRVLERLRADVEVFGFRLRYELGRGAFAVVFLAEQLALSQRLVVLKISEIEGSEPQTLAQMQHTHIVPIYSVHDDAAEGLRGVCMPYFGGATLDRVLATLWHDRPSPTSGKHLVDALRVVATPIAPTGVSDAPATQASLRVIENDSYIRAAARLVAQLADALHHAHQRGVIHSDVKPSNILLAADGQPLLLDFNVAQQVNSDASQSAMGGTISYAAPEHLQAMLTPVAGSRPVDERSDIYSLGLVLFKMLTGRNPFESRQVSNLEDLRDLQKEARRVPNDLSARRYRSDIPWSLESVLRRCLDRDRARRYHHADELAKDLRCFLDDQRLQHAPELSRVERFRKWCRRHPRLTSWASLTMTALVLLAALGMSIFGVIQHAEATQEELLRMQAQERRRDFETGATKALCLINTVTDLGDHLPQGARLCRDTLASYGVLDREDWQTQPAWVRLSAAERASVGENARELLLLLAWSEARPGPRERVRVQRALALLDRAEAIDCLPPSRALWNDRARYLEQIGEQDQANAARCRAAGIQLATAHDHYLLATSHARQGTTTALEQAISELDKALLLKPNHFWALTQRAICRQELGDETLALADFSACAGLWPDFAWSRFNRGCMLAKMGHKSQALEDFSAALELDPHLSAARFNRGLLHLELSQHANALADFEKAIEEGRDDVSIRAGRGIALEGLRRHADADQDFGHVFANLDALNESERTRILWVYGFAVIDRLPEKANAAFDQILVRQPRHPQSLLGKAQLALAKGRQIEALGHLEYAADADPHFIAARRSRAVVLARLGQLDRAASDINACLKREPRAGVTLYAAACVAALAAEQRNDAALTRQALDLLGKAMAQNYGRDRAATDSDLRSLRAHEIFKRLIAEP